MFVRWKVRSDIKNFQDELVMLCIPERNVSIFVMPLDSISWRPTRWGFQRLGLKKEIFWRVYPFCKWCPIWGSPKWKDFSKQYFPGECNCVCIVCSSSLRPSSLLWSSFKAKFWRFRSNGVVFRCWSVPKQLTTVLVFCWDFWRLENRPKLRVKPPKLCIDWRQWCDDSYQICRRICKYKTGETVSGLCL